MTPKVFHQVFGIRIISKHYFCITTFYGLVVNFDIYICLNQFIKNIFYQQTATTGGATTTKLSTNQTPWISLNEPMRGRRVQTTSQSSASEYFKNLLLLVVRTICLFFEVFWRTGASFCTLGVLPLYVNLRPFLYWPKFMIMMCFFSNKK